MVQSNLLNKENLPWVRTLALAPVRSPTSGRPRSFWLMWIARFSFFPDCRFHGIRGAQAWVSVFRLLRMNVQGCHPALAIWKHVELSTTGGFRPGAPSLFCFFVSVVRLRFLRFFDFSNTSLRPYSAAGLWSLNDRSPLWLVPRDKSRVTHYCAHLWMRVGSPGHGQCGLAGVMRPCYDQRLPTSTEEKLQW